MDGYFTSKAIKNKKIHIGMKKMYGLEHLDFYYEGHKLCCRYISNPYDFDCSKSVSNEELGFFLTAFSMQQGKVYFKDAGQWCLGLDGLKKIYLPMKLAGL